MMGSSSSWSSPTFGSATSSSLFSTPTSGSAMGSSSSSSWFAPTFGAPMGSSSSWSTLTIGRSTDVFGRQSTLFGSTTSPYSSIVPAFGKSSMPSPFGSFGWVSEKGSRVSAYTKTADGDRPNSCVEPNYYLQSISAMPVYNSKSHEELRHEDYQRGDKGDWSLQKSIVPSANHSWQHLPPVNPFTHFGEAAVKPCAELESSTQGLNSTTNPFWLPSLFSYPTEPTRKPSLFSYPTEPTHTPSLFSDPTEPIHKLSFFPNPTETNRNPHMGLQKTAFTYPHRSLPTPLTANGGTLFDTAAHTASAATSPTQPTTASFGPNSFPVSTRYGGNLFSSSSYSPCTACRENVISNSAACTASAATSSTVTQSHMFSQNLSPVTSTQSGGSLLSSSVAHSVPALSPDKCTTINIDHPKNAIDLLLPIDIRKVKIRFSSTNDGTGNLASQVHSAGHHNANTSATPISFSIYLGENEELTIQSMEHHAKCQTGQPSNPTSGFCPNDQNGPAGQQKGFNSDVHLTERSPLAAPNCKVISESALPRLYNADYYTVPSVVELAVRESEEPGYCSHVKDFTVGRHGYGSVKFDGQSDVRKLDIASIVEFNDREILVYRDESKRPPVGQELNKPAEVTLLNVRCIDQKTGLHLTDGPEVDRYKNILVQWTKDHGAEFVSFDAAKGEWKFRVKHFNQ